MGRERNHAGMPSELLCDVDLSRRGRWCRVAARAGPAAGRDRDRAPCGACVPPGIAPRAGVRRGAAPGRNGRLTRCPGPPGRTVETGGGPRGMARSGPDRRGLTLSTIRIPTALPMCLAPPAPGRRPGGRRNPPAAARCSGRCSGSAASSGSGRRRCGDGRGGSARRHPSQGAGSEARHGRLPDAPKRCLALSRPRRGGRLSYRTRFLSAAAPPLAQASRLPRMIGAACCA